MSDLDAFERRFAAAVRADADASVGRFDPALVARSAIASGRPRPMRGRLATVLNVRSPALRGAFVLIVLALVLAVVVGAIVVGALKSRLAVPSGWSVTGSMTQTRTWATATLLPDGRVLVAGGNDGGSSVASAELYDPSTGSWAATGSMGVPRQDHTATLLPDGRVLVAGGTDAGTDGGTTLPSAELFDPTTRSWAATGSMGEARADHTATLLPDGRVLVAGGFGVTTAELYDPRSGAFAPAGAMAHDRAYHTATLLPDGSVLVIGGFSGGGRVTALAEAEVYHPSSGAWTPVANLHEARAGHTATLLPDGRALVIGGSTSGDGFHPTASAELFDPGMGSWTATGSMSVPRVYAAATLLPDGTVLVAGGSSRTVNSDPGGPVAPAELYQPGSGSWAATARMNESRTYPTATLLSDGTVLVSCGRTKPILGSSIGSAERYGPERGSR